MDQEDLESFTRWLKSAGTWAMDVVLSLALALTLAGKWLWKTWLRLYFHVLKLIGTVARRGWRPILPWIFVYVCWGLANRIVNGLPLPDVAPLLGILAPMAGTTIVAQITRSIETRAGVSGGGGVVGAILGSFTESPAEGRTQAAPL